MLLVRAYTDFDSPVSCGVNHKPASISIYLDVFTCQTKLDMKANGADLIHLSLSSSLHAKHPINRGTNNSDKDRANGLLLLLSIVVPLFYRQHHTRNHAVWVYTDTQHEEFPRDETSAIR